MKKKTTDQSVMDACLMKIKEASYTLAIMGIDRQCAIEAVIEGREAGDARSRVAGSIKAVHDPA